MSGGNRVVVGRLQQQPGPATDGARSVVDVVAEETGASLPLPPLAAVAIAALAGAFDLGGGPLEGGADLVGLDLGD